MATIEIIRNERQGLAQNPQINDFNSYLKQAIQHSEQLKRSGILMLIHIKNLDVFQKSHPPLATKNILREYYTGFRKVIHPSHHVGILGHGLGVIFDGLEAGQLDVISNKLKGMGNQIIQNGRYNDLSARWGDIIQQFLLPSKPSIISTQMGWALFPRDGHTPEELLKRAQKHVQEQAR